jgi:hypothetical protein
MIKDIKGYYLWRGKWRASISINGKQKVLGIFEKEEDAKEAYLKAVEEKNKNRKGYFFDKIRRLWKVEIKSDRKRYYIGHYKNEDDARAAYISAKEKYHNIKLL